jgi:hypothetical protein
MTSSIFSEVSAEHMLMLSCQIDAPKNMGTARDRRVAGGITGNLLVLLQEYLRLNYDEMNSDG